MGSDRFGRLLRRRLQRRFTRLFSRGRRRRRLLSMGVGGAHGYDGGCFAGYDLEFTRFPVEFPTACQPQA